MRTADVAPLTSEQLDRIDRYWRAANYLSVGQIYPTFGSRVRAAGPQQDRISGW